MYQGAASIVWSFDFFSKMTTLHNIIAHMSENMFRARARRFFRSQQHLLYVVTVMRLSLIFIQIIRLLGIYPVSEA